MTEARKNPNRRILVIDDNQAIHQDFRKIFGPGIRSSSRLDSFETALFGGPSQSEERPVFEIDSAFQGQDGLAMVRRAVEEGRPYMMAFVDVRMPPGWDGVETTAKIWEHYPDLQVVICTAYSDYSLEKMLEQLGHTDRLVILKKPFDNIEVQQLASALTEKWQLLQQARRKMDDLERAVASRTRELKAANEKLQGEMDERQRAAEVLRATQEKLNHLLAASPVIIYSHKVEGQTLVPAWVSENITEVLGYGVEEWYQPDWITTHLYADDQPKVAAATQGLFDQGHCSDEYRLRRKDGTYRWIRDERKLLHDETGTATQVVGACTDITERRQLEEQLRQSQKMEAIGQLAGGVAHDFNNLLTVICCHTELMLGEKGLTPKMMDAVGQISRAAERAAALTRQLLAYGRKQVMHLRDLNLDELISRVLTMLQRVLGEDIALQIQCGEPGLTIMADEAMLEQIILNFAVNARDAMARGGQLIIRAASIEVKDDYVRRNPEARPGRFVCLSVSDTGCGIAPEILPRIFEPFFTTKDVGKGTGLGLATVYGIVQLHRGWMEVESQVGQGTTFKVFLPASTDPKRTVSDPSSPPAVVGGEETVLFVEDEPLLRELGRLVLEEYGYRVFEAETGAHALEVWETQAGAIDLLLTDMVMPGGLNGRELATQLRAEKPNLKVIYTSGYSADLLGKDSVLHVGLNFLPKPYNPQTLAATVRRCIDDQTLTGVSSAEEQPGASARLAP
jgi:PAS domain S-box-containing protein